MKWIRKIFSENEFLWTAIRFYAVGLLLFIIPYTRELFFFIIPVVLLLNLLVILYFHKEWSLKAGIVFFFVFLASLLLEMRGVTDPRIFGSYRYLDTLGLKINHTPLIIGVNWLMLVYGSHAIVSRKIKRPWLRIISASSLMVTYDIIIEVIAPEFEMWEFNQPYPPLQNFITWFITSAVFLSLFELARINTRNRYARILFIVQMAFFLILSLYIHFAHS